MALGVLLTGLAVALLYLTDKYDAGDGARHCSADYGISQSLGWLGCVAAAHEGLAGGVLAGAGALFAAWLAFDAVQEQIAEARKSSERQLRAYVFVDEAHFARPETEDGDARPWLIHVVIKNFGQTPAFNLTIKAARGIDLNAANSKALEIPSDADISPCVAVAPNHVTTMRLGGLENGVIDWRQAARLRQKVYLWGRVDYFDVFGHPHFTAFQMVCAFEQWVHQFGFLQHGNGTDDFRSPCYPLSPRG
jgi:hypothetical protein